MACLKTLPKKAVLQECWPVKDPGVPLLFDYDNDGDLDIVAANGTAEELILQYPLTAGK